MPKKFKRDALTGQLSALDDLIAQTPDEDIVGRMSLTYKRRDVAAAIENLGRDTSTLGSVILAFDGGPVVGSHGVDAEFAADAIRSYQDLIAAQMMSTETGGLAQRGPVPDKAATRLNITNVVHGSFGFQLEENGSDEPQFIDSPVKRSIVAVDNLIGDFSGRSEESYFKALDTVDRRVFISLQRFIENLYIDSASVKIIEDDRELRVDNNSVVLARSRVKGVSVEDIPFEIKGQLLGLAPVSRRFDFKSADSGNIISGQVGQKLSDDYLNRLSGDRRISGQLYTASLMRRVTTRADGSSSQSYTLIDLSDPRPLLAP